MNGMVLELVISSAHAIAQSTRRMIGTNRQQNMGFEACREAECQKHGTQRPTWASIVDRGKGTGQLACPKMKAPLQDLRTFGKHRAAGCGDSARPHS